MRARAAGAVLVVCAITSACGGADAPRPAPTTTAATTAETRDPTPVADTAPVADPTPDVDSDQDRLPDADDRCPNERETYNGRDDEDGCPDRAVDYIVPIADAFVERIYFQVRSSEILPVSGPIVEAMAGTLNGNPQFVRIAILGRATRGERNGARLAAARARALASALAARGVDATRLVLYTEIVDAGSNPDDQARARNAEPYLLRSADQTTDTVVPDLAHATAIGAVP